MTCGRQGTARGEGLEPAGEFIRGRVSRWREDGRAVLRPSADWLRRCFGGVRVPVGWVLALEGPSSARTAPEVRTRYRPGGPCAHDVGSHREPVPASLAGSINVKRLMQVFAVEGTAMAGWGNMIRVHVTCLSHWKCTVSPFSIINTRMPPATSVGMDDLQFTRVSSLLPRNVSAVQYGVSHWPAQPLTASRRLTLIALFDKPR